MSFTFTARIRVHELTLHSHNAFGTPTVQPPLLPLAVRITPVSAAAAGRRLYAGVIRSVASRVYLATSMTRLSDIVHSDPDILGGTPVFVGTRVPIQSLFDYLEGGEPLDEFLRQFPSVKRDQVLAALDLARATLLAGARSS
jgi:uncharacterized protein (DUF433 family)